MQKSLRHMAFDVYKKTKAGTLQTGVICEQQTLIDEKAIELNQLHRKAHMLRFELEKSESNSSTIDSVDNLQVR